MEEAENRREKLRAMKMEASTSSSATDPDTQNISPFSNPFSSPPSSSSPPPSPFTHFDFYTDPLTNFSSASNKRRPAPRDAFDSPQRFPTPISSQSHGVLGGSPFCGQLRSPGWYEANPGYNFNSHGDGYLPRVVNFSPNANPNSSPERINFGPSGAPGLISGRGYLNPGNNPNSLLGRGLSGFSPRHSLGFSSGGGSGRGGYNPGHSPNFGSSRGGRWNFSNSGGSGRNSGRGRGSISASVRPELFYDKSMLEDPWKDLVPTLGKFLQSESNRSWLPNSITSKKLKTSEDVDLTGSKSQSSLADCLSPMLHGYGTGYGYGTRYGYANFGKN